MDEITVSDLDNFCRRISEQNKICKDMAEHLKREKAVLEKMKAEGMAHLEALERENYKSDFCTIYTKNNFSVKLPAEPHNRKKFFNWMKEKGIFESKISVHSKTLVTMYNEFFELAQDPDFSIPGITDVKAYQTLNIRSK